jgi:hypothetical protein
VDQGRAHDVRQHARQLHGRKEGHRPPAAWQKDGGALYSPVPTTIWTAELPVQMLASVWSSGPTTSTPGTPEPSPSPIRR